jgi:formiminoglutamate deiminase
MTARYFCDYAWVGGATTEADVLISTAGDRIVAVDPGADRPPDAVHLRGLTLPGFANAHSHAFQRALRGRTQAGRGTFWTWREEMYRTAGALTPESYYHLARATYAEMALAGVTAVGEFHYVHHRPGGALYPDANAMGRALLAAAGDAGLRITLIDACYLESGPGRPPEGAQLSFADGSAQAWTERVGELVMDEPIAGARLGAAVHSVRAVPPLSAELVARFSRAHGLPLHFHLSEQVGENETAQAAYGLSPTELLGAAGALTPGSVAVHATHLSARDEVLLAGSGVGICMCPTTEQDLGDGIGPARRLASAGLPIALGSDSQAVIDPFQEMRSLEYDERLATHARGHWTAAELLAAATASGHLAIGWPEAGRLSVGALADLVTVNLSSPRLAGGDVDHLVDLAVFSACAADVTHVVSSGKVVVAEGRHVAVQDVAAALQSSIAAVVTP